MTWLNYYGTTEIAGIRVPNTIIIVFLSFFLIVIIYGILLLHIRKKAKREETKDIPKPARYHKETNKERENTKKELLKKRKEVLKELRELEKRRRLKTELAASVQETIPYIADYENGMFEIEKKKDKQIYSIAFEYEDINYSTLSPDDAQNIFLRFVDLYNLLPSGSDVQFILENKRVDTEIYRQSIHIPPKEDSFQDYREEMNGIQDKDVLNDNIKFQKQRCIVVSIQAENPLEASQVFLRLEAEIIQAIKRIGSRARRLTTMERFEQLHDILRPEAIGRFKDYNIDYEVFRKHRISMKDYICPDGMTFSFSNLQLGEKKGQALFIMDFPATMSDRFVMQLTDVSFDVRFCLTTKPLLMHDGIKLVNKSILGMESDRQKQEKNNIKAGYSPDMINHNLKTALIDAESLRDDIQNQNQKLFFTSIVIFHTADTEEALKSQKETLQGIAAQFLCQLRVLSNQQERGWRQSLPLGHNILDISTTTTTESTAVFIPFVSQELTSKTGFYYGINEISKNPIILNRTLLLNGNGFLLGGSGSGKSMFGKFEMANILLRTEDDVIVIDPDGEYYSFAEAFQGERIEISVQSPHHINPLDLDRDYLADRGDPVLAKTEFIVSVIETAIGDEDYGLTAGEKAIVEECVREAYRDLIDHDFDPDYTPTFRDLQEILDEFAGESFNASRISEAFTRVSRGTLSTFSHTTNVDIHKRFAVYDTSGLGGVKSQLSAMGSLIMLDAVWQRVIKNRRKGVRTWVYCDEFTVLLRLPSSKQFFLDVFKRIRKLKGCATGITQNLTSLYRDPDAMEMLANAEFLCLVNQSASDRIQLQEILGLSDTQLEYVTDADKGYGILKASRYIVPFKNIIPKETELYKAMTSDPEERNRFDKEKRVKNG